MKQPLVSLGGILPLGIKVLNECIDDQENLFTIVIRHQGHLANPFKDLLVRFQVGDAGQTIQAGIKGVDQHFLFHRLKSRVAI